LEAPEAPAAAEPSGAPTEQMSAPPSKVVTKPRKAKKAPGKERRRAPRAQVSLLARWEGDLGRREAEVTSLSQNGCFVLSGGKVKAKELIRLELLLPDGSAVLLWAEVVDEADEIGFAIQFTSVEAAEQERLNEFLEKCFSSMS